MLFDYGGTLVDEVRYDADAGLDAVLAHAATPIGAERRAAIRARAARVAREVADRRETHHVETPWISMARLVHDAFGTTFTMPWEVLERLFWNAAVTTVPTPGVHAALEACRSAGIRTAVLSNSSFTSPVIAHELSKHGLAASFEFVMVTADYAVRKPNPLVIDAAVARLGTNAGDTWFIGDRLDTDVAAARAAGLTAVWYTRDAGARTSGPDVVLTAWSDLVALTTRPRAPRS
jgi:putative hydrolase of the HAD superfamily